MARHRAAALLCAVTLAATLVSQAAAQLKPPDAAAGAAQRFEDHDSYDGGGPGKPGSSPEDESYYGTDSKHYDSPYGAAEECPNPQAADSVSDAYLNHYTFVWAEVAKEYANSKTARSARRQGSTPHAIPLRRPPRPSSSSSRGGPVSSLIERITQEARQAQKAQRGAQKSRGGRDSNAGLAAAQGPQSRTPTPAADGKAGQGQQGPAGKQKVVLSAADSSSNKTVAATTAAAAAATKGAASSGVEVRTAAVTNPGFLLPTGSEESGRGFEGTSDFYYVPTDQALAVGPHPQDPDSVVVLHGVNAAFEIFAASREGQQYKSDIPTKIFLDDIMNRMGYNITVLYSFDPVAFYDKKAHRYVAVWTTHYFDEVSVDEPPSPLVVCVSADDNALGTWTCWALDSYFESHPYAPYCGGLPQNSYLADYPQASYSDDGIFVNIGGFCDVNPYYTTYVNALFGFAKKTLYTTPPARTSGGSPDLSVYRATYLPSSSWYRSLPIKDQVLDYWPPYPPFNAFNSFLLPARPQSKEDVGDPVFVMGKVDGNQYMSIAKLTGEPLDKMDSIQNAPRIYATVLPKPDFRNEADYPPGDGVIPQPGSGTPNSNVTALDAGDVGEFGRTYGATTHRGRIYVATTEFFGARNTRVPSIFWAIVDPSHKLCKASVQQWGVVASADGLSLAFPSIAARREGGAVVGYTYGGDSNIRLRGRSYPAYAGSATTVVGSADADSVINIVKRGERLITRRPRDDPKRWGDYSAIDFVDGVAWFSVPVALDIVGQYGSWISTEQL